MLKPLYGVIKLYVILKHTNTDQQKGIDIMANTSLHAAKDAKNDEFYTRLEDINEEMNHYEDKFRGKVVFCNCDDPKWSNFWKYFHLNFEYLGLKKLITTHYEPGEVQSYKIEYTGGNDEDFEEGTITPLEQNGDFRSDECIALLDEADIVVTNPPFSLARDYIDVLSKHNKLFLIIGDLNWITYKEMFALLQSNEMWLGYNSVKSFIQPDGTIKKFGNKLWFTNIDIKKRHNLLDTTYYYSKKDSLYPELYPKYDNYNAINVDKVKEIPMDYTGVMGVPITFMNQYNPDQFEILGFMDRQDDVNGLKTKVYTKSDCSNYNDLNRCGAIVVDGQLKSVYMRIFVRRKAGE